MTEEELAQELHEAGREAVKRNLVVRTDVPTKGFMEWNDLTEEAREGRRVQARFLLAKFEIGPIRTFEGLIEGRCVHYVDENGVHHAATVSNVPGTLLSGGKHRLEPAGENITSQLPGLADLCVFAKTEVKRRELALHPDSFPVFSVLGVLYDNAGKAPGTWHYIERG